RQRVCSSPDCQKKRQLDSMKVWREKNPNYFKYDESKGVVWLETQRKRSKIWRSKNPEKVKAYRQTHLSEYRQYMRDYMRRYREQKKQAPPSAAPASEPPQNPPATS
ncbi:MAG TPA: hypothetical protein VD883_00320, partial [Candidatus Omnitrophota bacterium]|nr:hypothetical protein [Candidatus Omnitrophota bacterium]